MVLLLQLLPRTTPLAPSFDVFSDRVTGSWRGSCFEWFDSDPSDDELLKARNTDDGFIERGRRAEEAISLAGLCSPSSFYMVPPSPVSSSVEEVMRSCGGAVQGVRESWSWSSLEDDPERSLFLNRQNDGFTFFDDGSYTLGPEKLDAEAETPPLLTLDASLVHGDGSRRVLRLWFDDDARSTARLSGACVACLVRGDGSEGTAARAVADAWESGQLSIAAAAGQGGSGNRGGDDEDDEEEEQNDDDGKLGSANVEIVEEEATPPSAGSPWIATRLKWRTRKSNVDNGEASSSSSSSSTSSSSPLSSSSASVRSRVELPGGCFVETALGKEDASLLEVMVGSRSTAGEGEGAMMEEKSLLRCYDLASGHLGRVQMRTTTTTRGGL